MDRVANNGMCQLPCLLGLMPGQDKSVSLEPFLAQFESIVSPDETVVIQREEYESSGFLFLLSATSQEVELRVSFGYYLQEDTVAALAAFIEARSPLDQSVLFGTPAYTQAARYYLLPEILSNYGQPTRVLMAPFPDVPEMPNPLWTPFSLVLYYEEAGFMIEYITPREVEASHFVGCPNLSQVGLIVWDPSRPLSFSQAVVRLPGAGINELNFDYFKPVESATELSLTAFFSTFKIHQNTACLTTPVELWS